MIDDKDYTADILLDCSLEERQTYVFRFFGDYNIRPLFDESVSYGETHDRDGRVEYMEVGVSELRDFKQNETPYVFVTAIVSGHHELAHGRQIENLRDKNTDLSRCILFNHYACKCSYEYYYSDVLTNPNEILKHYQDQPKEIAAQYDAILSSYEYFANIFKDEKLANDLICGYVNTRISRNEEFIITDEPFTDIKDIKKAFEDKFERVQQEQKHISFEVKGDVLSKYFDKHKFDIKGVRRRLENKDYDTEILLSSIYAEMEPDDSEFVNFPCFKGYTDFKEQNRFFGSKDVNRNIADLSELYDILDMDDSEDDFEYE